MNVVYVFTAVPSNPELVTTNGSSDNLLALKVSPNYRRHSSFQGLGKVSVRICQIYKTRETGATIASIPQKTSTQAGFLPPIWF